MVSVREAETSDNNIKLIDNLEEHSYIKITEPRFKPFKELLYKSKNYI